MVPGLTGSGPGHWQSLWQERHPAYARVEQRDWDRPEPGEWIAALDAAIASAPAPALVIGHSLGCITIVHRVAQRGPEGIAAAMLVAPCDVEAPSAPAETRSFAPIPLDRLPFPTLVVCGEDDPLLSLERGRAMAAAWGGEFLSIAGAGHINTAAGFGPWPEGHALLDRVGARVGSAAPAAQPRTLRERRP